MQNAKDWAARLDMLGNTTFHFERVRGTCRKPKRRSEGARHVGNPIKTEYRKIAQCGVSCNIEH